MHFFYKSCKTSNDLKIYVFYILVRLLTGMKVTNEAEALTAIGILHDKGVRIVVLSSLDASGTDLASYVSLKCPSMNDAVLQSYI